MARRRKNIKVNNRVFIHTAIYFIFLSSSYSCTACTLSILFWATDLFTAKMLPCNNRKTAVVNITHGSVSYDRKLAWTVKVAPPNESQSFGWCKRGIFFLASFHPWAHFISCLCLLIFLSSLWLRNLCRSNILEDVSIPKMHHRSEKNKDRGDFHSEQTVVISGVRALLKVFSFYLNVFAQRFYQVF